MSVGNSSVTGRKHRLLERTGNLHQILTEIPETQIEPKLGLTFHAGQQCSVQ